ncbi:hypothetical protein [Nitrosomonas communis]|uniref:hypothetical protein n=1 Tax=Nitrosomonas communis TaxID=44574 RepID=UPI003D29AF97
MERIEAELRACGVQSEQIERAKVDWHRSNVIDLSRSVVEPIDEAIEAFMGRELQKVGGNEHTSSGIALAEQYRENLRSLRSKLTDPSFPSLVEAFIDSAEFLDVESKQRIRKKVDEPMRELRYYLAHRDFLDKEKWFAGG